MYVSPAAAPTQDPLHPRGKAREHQRGQEVTHLAALSIAWRTGAIATALATVIGGDLLDPDQWEMCEQPSSMCRGPAAHTCAGHHLPGHRGKPTGQATSPLNLKAKLPVGKGRGAGNPHSCAVCCAWNQQLPVSRRQAQRSQILPLEHSCCGAAPEPPTSGLGLQDRAWEPSPGLEGPAQGLTLKEAWTRWAEPGLHQPSCGRAFRFAEQFVPVGADRLP